MLVITTYFNPFRDVRRSKNYQLFRKSLTCPLLTVEWSQNGHFELTHNDADILIQEQGGSLLWQKEALLNLALKHITGDIEYIAWIDCDVLFEDDHWITEAIHALENAAVVQLFETVIHLPNRELALLDRKSLFQRGSIGLDVSLASVLRNHNKLYKTPKPLNPQDRVISKLFGNPGLALATKIDTLKQIQFYDGNIVGGGDTVFFAGLTNTLNEVFSYRLFSEEHQKHIMEWARNITSDRTITYLPRSIYHLWHGDIKKRKYTPRHAILTDFAYNPSEHLMRDPNGVWKFKDQEGPLESAIYNYFESRQ